MLRDKEIGMKLGVYTNVDPVLLPSEEFVRELERLDGKKRSIISAPMHRKIMAQRRQVSKAVKAVMDYVAAKG